MYLASKKPGGRTLCDGRCVKNGFYSTLNHHELDKSNNSADKDLSLSFFLHTSSSLGKMKSLLIFFLLKTLSQVLLHDTQQIMMAFLPICKRVNIPLWILILTEIFVPKVFYVIKGFYQVCVELLAVHAGFIFKL